MVHIQSERSIKDDLEALKLLGTIIAISKRSDVVIAVYKDGSLRYSKSYGVTNVSKHRIPLILEKDPWLGFQVDLSNNILVMSDVDRFCNEVELHVHRAKDMTFHKKFNIYFPFSEEWEVEIEVI